MLLSEASVALNDDITSPQGSVELLRLTLSRLLVNVAPAQSELDPTGLGLGGCGGAAEACQVEVYCASLQVCVCVCGPTFPHKQQSPFPM